MGEKLTIWRTEKPYTKSRLINELKKAGLKEGDTIIFHASMSQAGWICGGAITVIDALQSVVTKNGTIVMPAQTGGLTDPENWENPPYQKLGGKKYVRQCLFSIKNGHQAIKWVSLLKHFVRSQMYVVAITPFTPLQLGAKRQRKSYKTIL
ncbi:aminoglycoside N3-acetyltransferase [Listeria fleischmannii subsp. fleischmannii LU2006-1]|nr:aminoglycoside N3-acetyltransferase [Listeria fleischmannii subsp. fleischmannii LU2006-1]